MSLRTGLLCLLSSIYFHISAQTVVSGVVTDSSNQPIPFASVYLSKTTIGTTTSNEGFYTLAIPQEGEYELTASCIGYNTFSAPLSATGKKQVVNIRLQLNQVQLDEITVSSKAKKRVRNYTAFTKLLLGETDNAQTCTIRNLEDLYLYEDPATGVINGRSHKPIQIENRALGYLVTYDFTDVTYNPATGLFQYNGGLYFRQMDGNERNIRRWTRNRLITYYGSRMHFLRSLFLDSLRRESFSVSDYTTETVTPKPVSQPKSVLTASDSIHTRRTPDRIRFFARHPLQITWFNNHPELASEAIGYEPARYKSTIEFSDSLTVYRNGYFVHPFAVTWGGEMARERIANLLPFDYTPGQTVANSQAPEGNTAADPLTSIQKAAVHDQVFVQLDRNIYRPGDTIFFQAFIKDRISNTFESNSQSLYTLLFNPKKTIADSSRYKIRNSAASGWVPIPVNAEPGRYRLAAFTGMMQNFDPSEAFQTDLEVTDPAMKRGKPGATRDAAKETGDAFTDIRFLPEGGNYISGIRQRIGFNATNNKGEPVPVEGLLKDNSGAILDTIRPGMYGPGSFFCTAKPGLTLEITRGAGPKTRWPLPEPTTKGITLGVSPADEESFLVDVQSDYYISEPVFLVVNMDLSQVFSKELTLNKRQQVIVDTRHLPSGVADIVLLNKDMVPVAERLFYINPAKHLKYNIVHTPNQGTGNEMELSVTVTDGRGNPVEGLFSLAVTDSLKGINTALFAPGIEYTLNYHPYLMGNLPGEALLKGLENLPEEERDLLLLVFGWKKYRNPADAINTREIPMVNFDLLSIRLQNTGRNQKANRRLDLCSMEDLTIHKLQTNNTGEAFLPLDSLSDMTRSVTLMPDMKSKNRVPEALLSIPWDRQYFTSSRLFLPIPGVTPPHPLAALQTGEPKPQAAQENYSLGEKNIEIPEVVIIGRQANSKVYHDQYEQAYQIGNVHSLDIEPLQSSTTLEIALRKLVSPYQITEDNIILRPPRSIFGIGGPATALIVLDGMPMYLQGWAMVKDIPPSEVTSLTVLNGQQGYARYGDGSQGGVIFINTKSGNPEQVAGRTRWGSQNRNGNLLKAVEIYRNDVEYYCPPKPESGLDPMLQGRGTIFWKSDIYYDGQNPMKIKFNSTGHSGPVSVIINGISVNHLCGTGRAGYEIRER